MRKRLLSKLVYLFLLISVFYSCEEVEPPVAGFLATKVEIDGKIYVKFTDESSNDPDSWEWTFEGGIPRTSKEQNPTVLFNQVGKHKVRLISSNEGGMDRFYEDDFINVVYFSNLMQTDAEVSMGDETVTIEANSNHFFVNFHTFKTKCHVETSGKKPNGEQLGLFINWDFTVDLDIYHSYILGLSSELVFFNLTNNSNFTFNYFIANCGNPDFESLEEVLIRNDGVKQPLGYYFANSGMEVCALFSGGYVSWIDKDSFDLPRNNNQFVDLSVDGEIIKLNKQELDPVEVNPTFNIGTLQIEGQIKKR